MAAEVVEKVTDKYVLQIWCGKCGVRSIADKWRFDCMPTGGRVKYATIECPNCHVKHKGGSVDTR